jgi:hypothetical protein
MAKSKSKIRKKRKNNMPIVLDMDDLYKILNKVQIDNEEQIFELNDFSLIPQVENIIKDSTLRFKKNIKKSKVIFSISPGEHEFCKEIELDILEDEIPDESFLL